MKPAESFRWVDIVTKAPLWESIPDDHRVTKEAILRRYPPGQYAEFVSERLLKRLQNPLCEIAVRGPEFGNRWIPCGQEVAEGATRCRRHGGPTAGTSPLSRRNALKEENERLRAELAALKGARLDGVKEGTE